MDWNRKNNDRYASMLKLKWPDWHLENAVSRDAWNITYVAKREDIAGTSYALVKAVPIQNEQRRSLSFASSQAQEKAIQYVKSLRRLYTLRDCNALAVPMDDTIVPTPTKDGYVVFVRYEDLKPLTDVMKENISDIVKIFHMLCTAMMACERCGIPHGEIKLSNVMLHPKGHFCYANLDDLSLLESRHYSEKPNLEQIICLVSGLLSSTHDAQMYGQPSGAYVLLDGFISCLKAYGSKITLQEALAQLDALMPTLDLYWQVQDNLIDTIPIVSMPENHSGKRDVSDPDRTISVRSSANMLNKKPHDLIPNVPMPQHHRPLEEDAFDPDKTTRVHPSPNDFLKEQKQASIDQGAFPSPNTNQPAPSVGHRSIPREDDFDKTIGTRR